MKMQQVSLEKRAEDSANAANLSHRTGDWARKGKKACRLFAGFSINWRLIGNLPAWVLAFRASPTFTPFQKTGNMAK
jgi:hypothetical protein